MTCADSARAEVLRCAELLETQARGMALLRSVDATESAKWLREVAAELRKAAEPDESEASVPSADGEGASSLHDEQENRGSVPTELDSAESPEDDTSRSVVAAGSALSAGPSGHIDSRLVHSEQAVQRADGAGTSAPTAGDDSAVIGTRPEANSAAVAPSPPAEPAKVFGGGKERINAMLDAAERGELKQRWCWKCGQWLEDLCDEPTHLALLFEKLPPEQVVGAMGEEMRGVMLRALAPEENEKHLAWCKEVLAGLDRAIEERDEALARAEKATCVRDDATERAARYQRHWATEVERADQAIRERDEARAEVKRLQVADWRPIESVPRDGTKLLLWCDDGDGGEFNIGWFGSRSGRLFTLTLDESRPERWTHWTPLTPPEGK